MTRQLLLLRHGKSDWDAGTDDFHRPLKSRGKRGAQRIGIWLAQEQLIPDLVISSTAERAMATAQKCCKAMGIYVKQIEKDKRIYLASPEELLQVLADCPADAQRVMLVGHNPGLEELLYYLADKSIKTPEDGKLMPTATVAQLQMPANWSSLKKGQAKLLQIVRAKSLPDKFPYPEPNSIELRNRPAYYYTQSSVIPYRINKGKLEILTIRSNQNKHWVVPKGIADTGLSLQDSARKEAWEEAGVEGNILEEALGTYRYKKWGATCKVTVYAMEVTNQLSDDEWEEQHRGRQWVSAKKAATSLKQVELVPMILTLEKQLLS